MKKYVRSVFVILAAALVLLSLPGCDQSGDDGVDPPPSSGRYESVEDLASLAAIETGGTYTVILGNGINISDRWGDINSAIRAAKKYVVLDLSQCAVTDDAIEGSQTPGGNDFNIIRYNPYITGLILPESLQFIDNSSFRNCIYLTSVVIPDGVLSIGSMAFRGCSALGNIIIPDSVNSIGEYAFQDCTGLASISLSHDTASVAPGLFSGCTSLVNVNIPDSVTSIGQGAFSGCSSLTDIDIPDSVGTIDYHAFYNCASLTSVTFKQRSVSLQIGASACSNSALNTVIFEDTNVTIANNNSFPYTSTSLKAAYDGGGAGTYPLGGGSWSKN
jgi:hypothetical protein